MSADAIVRLISGVAAVAIAGVPAASWLVDTIKARLSAGRSETEATAIGIREMRTVLDLAERCRVAGCVEGVSLCQQLIDVMLGGCKGGK